MSDKPQHKNPRVPNQKRHFQKQAPVVSPEEQAKILAARQVAAEEAEKERQRVELYGKSVEKMSHRQLRSELVKSVKREYSGRPPQPQAGLTIALSTIFLSVLDNTKTVVDKHTRRDQINPSPRGTMNPGW